MDTGPVTSSAGEQRRQPHFRDRLITEAVRSYEEKETAPQSETDAADTFARLAPGDFEAKLVARGAAHPSAGLLAAALRQVGKAVALTVIIGMILAALAGAGAARAALGVGGEQTVNFFWALAGLLGLQTLVLLGWLILLIFGARGLSSASLGGILTAVARWLAVRLNKGRAQQAAVTAAAGTYGRGRIGVWSLSALSHSMWLLFNLACVLVLLALLSTHQYRFTWETTILSDDAFTRVTATLAYIPGKLGIEAPTEEQIDASRRAESIAIDDETQRAWAQLLVISVIFYGLFPRAVLLGLSLANRRWAIVRFRLDTGQPGYARLRPRLCPDVERLDFAGGRSADAAELPTPKTAIYRAPALRPIGPPALMGLEIEAPHLGWPPPIFDDPPDDLGLVDDGDARRAVLASLSESPTQPALLGIVCSLTTTPDRGLAAFIREVASAITRPVLVVLSGGDTLRKREPHVDVSQRVDDWRAMLTGACVAGDLVVELDLDCLTDAGRTKLRELIATNSAGMLEDGGELFEESPSPKRRLESAFALVAERAERWLEVSGSASIQDQADLQRSIAKLFRQDERAWRDLLKLPAGLEKLDPTEMTSALRSGSERVLSLVPARLKSSPKWLAAGAITGALACVAVATLATPVALASLPVWSGLGAAVAGALGLSAGSGGNEAGEPTLADQISADQAVRSAALFGMLLELQGRGEALISRVLDKALPDANEASLESAEQVAGFLIELKHRFDMALAAEASA